MQSNAFTSSQSPPSETLTLRRLPRSSVRFSSLVSSPPQQQRRFPRLCISDISASLKSSLWCLKSTDKDGDWRGGRKERFEVSAASEEVGDVEIESSTDTPPSMILRISLVKERTLFCTLLIHTLNTQRWICATFFPNCSEHSLLVLRYQYMSASNKTTCRLIRTTTCRPSICRPC